MGDLSARGWTRTLRLARTIADLEGSDAIRRAHFAEALIYRRIGPGRSLSGAVGRSGRGVKAPAEPTR